MKTSIKITCLFLLLLPFTTTQAQTEKYNLPEKLSMFFNNKVKVVVESMEILKIPQDDKQDSIFRTMLKDINKIQDSLSRISTPLNIYYSIFDKNSRKLRVCPNNEAKAEFIFKGNSDTITSSFFNYQIEYYINRTNKLFIYTNKLSDLECLDKITYTDILKQIKTDLSNKKIASFRSKICTYPICNNTLDLNHAEISKKGSFMISSGMDFGLAYLNDRFVPNISFSLAYIFSPKSEIKNMVGIDFQQFMNIDPNMAYHLEGNQFVDVFFNAKMPNHPFYYGTDLRVFAGYLVHRQGNLFQENTWRWGFDMPAGKNFRISYVLYRGKGSGDKELGLFEIGLKYRLF